MTEEAAQPRDDARPTRRAPRKITADYLRRAAMHYLERYAAPSMQLRRVLQRKIVLSCRHHGDDPAGFAAMLDEAVARCIASGLVDDRSYAQARAASLRRGGRSARAVAGKLAAKGVARDIVAQESATSEEEELAAARIAARRKRLGPWSRGDRAASRQKDIAGLARAGFPLAAARAAVDGSAEDAEP